MKHKITINGKEMERMEAEDKKASSILASVKVPNISPEQIRKFYDFYKRFPFSLVRQIIRNGTIRRTQ